VLTAGDVVEVLGSVTLVSWVIVEALAAWAQRPPVVFDPWTRRWRAQRAMEKDQQTFRLTHPPTMPTRLRVVEDLAS
jgi:hypothetical protein